MLKFLLRFTVCVSIACYSAILKEAEYPDLPKAIEDDLRTNLWQLKVDYLTKLRQLKENATLGVNSLDITEQIHHLNNKFHAQANTLSDMFKHSLSLFGENRYKRCIDDIEQWINELFDDDDSEPTTGVSITSGGSSNLANSVTPSNTLIPPGDSAANAAVQNGPSPNIAASSTTPAASNAGVTPAEPSD